MITKLHQSQRGEKMVRWTAARAEVGKGMGAYCRIGLEFGFWTSYFSHCCDNVNDKDSIRRIYSGLVRWLRG